MRELLLIGAILVVIAGLVVSLVLLRRRPRKVNVEHLQIRWRDMQKLCAQKETWPDALTQADKLLDDVLKKRRYGGKSMGERLTKAQRVLSNNEAVWFGHKLRKKLESEPGMKLREKDVKQALIGIRQALKDLGALPGDN
jgi:hypothetical protein